MTTIDFLVVTYPADYVWLRYLFRSIEKYATGFRKLILVVEEREPLPDDLPTYVEVKRCRNYLRRGEAPSSPGDVSGYFGQSIEGMRAHQHSDAEVIWILESDCVFKRPIDLQNDHNYPVARPEIIWRPWEDAGPAKCWADAVRDLLQHEPPAECGCCLPFIYPRGLYRATWEHVGGETALVEVVKTGKSLSQCNVIGNYGLILEDMLGEQPAFRSRRCTAEQIARQCIHQFWSHAGINDPAVQSKLRELGLS
jgi:hypothetical protein